MAGGEFLGVLYMHMRSLVVSFLKSGRKQEFMLSVEIGGYQ